MFQLQREAVVSELCERIIDHYEKHACDWDRDRRACDWLEKSWHDRFASLLLRGAHVLDLGCGGGIPVAQNLASRGFKVTGLDSSPTLVSLCRNRLPDQLWIVGDMRAFDSGRTFDGILAWDSFFHLAPDDQRCVLALIAKQAHAGSIVMFNSGPAAGEAIGCYRGDPLYHASLDAEEYAALLGRLAFEIIDHRPEDKEAGGRTVWLARKIRAS